MWNKIYLVALAIAVLPMIFITYYASSWLQSIGSPMAAIIGFNSTSRIAYYWLWISTAVLIVMANVVLWNHLKAWAMWTTLAYLVVFLLLQAFWLHPTSNLFIASNNLPFETPILRPLVLMITAVVAGIIVYFDQLAVVRMRERIHPSAPELVAADAVPQVRDDTLTGEENEST